MCKKAMLYLHRNEFKEQVKMLGEQNIRLMFGGILLDEEAFPFFFSFDGARV
jgi:TfoX/Sxy family transcriptional regulator of competence genes